MTGKPKRTKSQWFRIDLHLHTPGSSDYQDSEASYLDVLRRAEMRGLDIIAFADHNTVAGYRAMLTEIEQLALLEKLDRAQPEEKRRLTEYRRLLDRILVLPGFEFTATFGFHILGIFSPETRVRQLEHILLSLNIPPNTLDEGSSNVGASSDVLTAYRVINESGGIVIAAHANSSHGVAMRGFDFGGQTKIAYTQDPYLHALEVTDLDRRGRGTTSRFFDGTKPEYPRRMRLVQGSDAHRLIKDPRNEKNLGVGDRITEVLLPERSFEALREMFQSNDFARSRPYRGSSKDIYDYIKAAREQGPSIVQAFHESMVRQGGRLYSVIADICAFANTNGGTIYIGAAADVGIPVVGVDNIGENIDQLRTEIEHKLTPPLNIEIDAQETQGKTVIRVQIPRGDDPPYAIDENKIYVRDEGETTLAVRDEIVRLVQKNGKNGRAIEHPPVAVITNVSPPVIEPGIESEPEEILLPDMPEIAAEGEPVEIAEVAEVTEGTEQPTEAPAKRSRRPRPPKQAPARDKAPLSNAPRTGVEILGTETRKGEQYHIMRDLRNGNIVKNVTRSSARRLWHYAIIEREANPVDLSRVQWAEGGEIGLWKRYKRGGVIRYDLVQRENGNVRVFYGVTDDGMHGPWQQFISDDAPVEEAPEEDAG
ncbi:MAG: putative DNA binding domain-containing protein [Anaerolineae bacterium]|nr:putative DNA binding domain-containing protein [Anaerolineae bacterium]